VRLSHLDQTAEVELCGGRLVSYAVGGVPVLTPLDLPATAYPNALLAPWPNRLAHGTWTWKGESLRLPVNDHSLGSALHGLVHDVPFTSVSQDGASVHLRHDLAASPGYPFSLRVEATYALTPHGLVCALAATNTGDGPAPVALGVHPYLDTRGPADDVVLTVPSARSVAIDEHWQEIGRQAVIDTLSDLRTGRRLGHTALDATWTELAHAGDRVTFRLELPGGDVIEVWGGPTCRYVVVFSADTLPDAFTRRTLAVEPCTAPANALRSGTDLDVVAPGETLRLDWGLRASWAAT
jgi:aldose 1-epimerase